MLQSNRIFYMKNLNVSATKSFNRKTDAAKNHAFQKAKSKAGSIIRRLKITNNHQQIAKEKPHSTNPFSPFVVFFTRCTHSSEALLPQLFEQHFSPNLRQEFVKFLRSLSDWRREFEDHIRITITPICLIIGRCSVGQ